MEAELHESAQEYNVNCARLEQNYSAMEEGTNPSPADVTKLKQENVELRKEIQAMESKLKSNMKSIKSFWSPELKKEKAARIEQGDRYLALQEQYTTLSKETQELQRSLEAEKSKVRELRSGDGKRESTSSNNETVSILLERIKELENESLHLQKQVDCKEVAISKLEDLMQSIEAERETSQMQSLLDVLSKVTCLEEHIASRDETITDLQNELEISKSQSLLVTELQEILSMKDEEMTRLSDKCNELESQLEHLRDSSEKNVKDEENKYKEELKKKEEVFESHSKFIKAKVESLKGEVAKKDTELAAAQTKVETFEKHQSDLQEHISVLHSSNTSKENHIQNLQQELHLLRSRLDEKEKILGDREKELASVSSLQSRNSGEVDVLNTLMQSKEKQVAVLKDKCEGLENELLEKSQLLSSSKSHAADVEADYNNVCSNMKTLQKTAKEKETKITSLENKNISLLEEHDRETQNAQRQLSTLQTKLLQKEAALQGKEEELLSTRSQNIQEENRASNLEKSMRDRESALDEFKMDLKRKNEEITRLNDDISRHKSGLEKSQDECKHLTKELSELRECSTKMTADVKEKDDKLEDVEKQLREQTKKLSTCKRNQQLERERHSSLLNDIKQQLTESDENLLEIKNQLESKTERVSILEEALQETVNSVSENERLLGEQTSKCYEFEVELANLKIENTVTNTKNASLILSLSERDIALTYYRNERKRMNAEVLEMKQNALLATISEKDTNVAILEQNPTIKGEQEVRKLKAEKDHLVDQLKQLNQKRVLILSDDCNMTAATELSQGSKETVLANLALLDANAEKLSFYVNSLADVMKEHYKDIYRTLPRSPSPRELKILEHDETTNSELLKEVECHVEYMQSLQDYIEVMLESLEETEHDLQHGAGTAEINM